jgi:hypothetical protein
MQPKNAELCIKFRFLSFSGWTLTITGWIYEQKIELMEVFICNIGDTTGGGCKG